MVQSLPLPFRILVSLLPALVLSSCCGSTRSCAERPATEPPWHQPTQEPLRPQEMQECANSLRSCVQRRADGRPLRLLALSGGGQNGAFGVGFLQGWRQRPGSSAGTPAGDPRPVFDVVTGVSTGALMATFAFLGTPEDDATLERFYTGISAEDLVRRRGLLGAISSNSLYSVGPLKQRIAEAITPEVLERVAAAHLAGRRLFVATVNADAGRLTLWDLGELARREGPEGVERYREILQASAMVPVVFPPVLIDGAMHLDAGVREQVFMRTFVSSLAAQVSRARAEGLPLSSPPVQVDVIVNGKIGVGWTCVEDCILDIGRRSLDLLLDEALIGSLFRVYCLTLQQGWSFRMVRIPDDFPAGHDSQAFDRETMRRLHEKGMELGRMADPWEKTPPTAGDLPGGQH